MKQYTTDGEEWQRVDDEIIISSDIFCGYDGCGEEGPIRLNKECLETMLRALSDDPFDAPIVSQAEWEQMSKEERINLIENAIAVCEGR